MALNNIWREPQRELTEQALGLGVILLGALVDFKIMKYCEAHASHPYDLGTKACAMACIPMLIALGVLGGAFVIWLMHELGEAVANGLAKRGLELRPKERK